MTLGQTKQDKPVRRFVSLCVLTSFIISSVISPKAFAATPLLGLPEPGTLVNLSPAFNPVMVKGLTVHPENPLMFDFIVSSGKTGLKGMALKDESQKLIKYFLACLTVPEKNWWVNLSPYEKDRIVPEDLGQTDLGRDMLAQDYVLKQITASLIYPEKKIGKDFWDRVYAKSQAQFGTTQIPVNTFNKVWVLADKAEVLERNNTAFIVGSHLKVMLDEDYLAMTKNQAPTKNVSSQIIRDIVIPELEKEVNTGKNFAQLRQIYHALILANWYKTRLKDALLNQVYANQGKVQGIDLADKDVKNKIYQRYLSAYKKGVFNYIKEDVNNANKQPLPRKYFSGGLIPGAKVETRTVAKPGDLAVISLDPTLSNVMVALGRNDLAMTTQQRVSSFIDQGLVEDEQELRRSYETASDLSLPEEERYWGTFDAWMERFYDLLEEAKQQSRLSAIQIHQKYEQRRQELAVLRQRKLHNQPIPTFFRYLETENHSSSPRSQADLQNAAMTVDELRREINLLAPKAGVNFSGVRVTRTVNGFNGVINLSGGNAATIESIIGRIQDLARENFPNYSLVFPGSSRTDFIQFELQPLPQVQSVEQNAAMVAVNYNGDRLAKTAAEQLAEYKASSVVISPPSKSELEALDSAKKYLEGKGKATTNKVIVNVVESSVKTFGIFAQESDERTTVFIERALLNDMQQAGENPLVRALIYALANGTHEDKKVLEAEYAIDTFGQDALKQKYGTDFVKFQSDLIGQIAVGQRNETTAQEIELRLKKLISEMLVQRMNGETKANDGNVVYFGLAADPLHFGQIETLLRSMVQAKVSKGAFRVHGKDDRKPRVNASLEFRHELTKRFVELFGQNVLEYSDVGKNNELDAESDFINFIKQKAVQKDPSKPIRIYYLVGSDHMHFYAPDFKGPKDAEGRVQALRKEGVQRPDTLQKFEKFAKDSTNAKILNDNNVSFTVLFNERDPKESMPIHEELAELERLKQENPYPYVLLRHSNLEGASSTAIRNALAGVGNVDDLTILPKFIRDEIMRLGKYRGLLIELPAVLKAIIGGDHKAANIDLFRNWVALERASGAIVSPQSLFDYFAAIESSLTLPGLAEALELINDSAMRSSVGELKERAGVVFDQIKSSGKVVDARDAIDVLLRANIGLSKYGIWGKSVGVKGVELIWHVGISSLVVLNEGDFIDFVGAVAERNSSIAKALLDRLENPAMSSLPNAQVHMPVRDYRMGKGPLAPGTIPVKRSWQEVIALLAQAKTNGVPLEIVGHLRGMDGAGSSLDLPLFQIKLTPGKKDLNSFSQLPSTVTITSDQNVRIEFTIDENNPNAITYEAPDYLGEGRVYTETGEVQLTDKGRLPKGQLQAPAYIFRNIFGLRGIRVKLSAISPTALAGGMGSSGAANVMLITAASILSGANLSYADIVALAVKLENDEFGGLTGGQESWSTVLGGGHQLVWLSGIEGNNYGVATRELFTPEQLKWISEHIYLVQAGKSYTNGKANTDRTAALVNYMWTDLLNDDPVGQGLHGRKIALADAYADALTKQDGKEIVRILNEYADIRDQLARRWMNLMLDAKQGKDVPAYAKEYARKVFESKNDEERKDYQVVKHLYDELVVRLGREDVFRALSLYSTEDIPNLIRDVEALGTKFDLTNTFQHRVRKAGGAAFDAGAGGPGSIKIVVFPGGKADAESFFDAEKINQLSDAQVREVVRGTGTLRTRLPMHQGAPLKIIGFNQLRDAKGQLANPVAPPVRDVKPADVGIVDMEQRAVAIFDRIKDSRKVVEGALILEKMNLTDNSLRKYGLFERREDWREGIGLENFAGDDEVFVIKHINNLVLLVRDLVKMGELKLVDEFLTSIDSAQSSFKTREGGINFDPANLGMTVTKDGNGVKITVDKAMIERMKREGVSGFTPVIINIVPIANIFPILGLQAPSRREVGQLAGV